MALSKSEIINTETGKFLLTTVFDKIDFSQKFMNKTFGEFITKSGKKGALYRCNTCPYAKRMIHPSEKEIKIKGVKL